MFTVLTTKQFKLSILIVFIIYLGLRCVAWSGTYLFEDTDSIPYLRQIELFSSASLNEIIHMNPDATPFYPFFGALCALPVWSTEVAARLCSLLFSVLLFFCIFFIGKRITDKASILVGFIILSLHHILIPLSYSVLTEPSYIATCYLGLWFFIVQFRTLRIWQGALLGFIFGLSFLNRTEGLLYIGLIPCIQGVLFLFDKQRKYNVKQFVGWVLAYCVVFALLSAPQIWRVSKKMGMFSINGRQAWTVIFKNKDGKSKEEQIFGLNYDPGIINLYYIRTHPEIQKQLMKKTELKNYLKVISKNFTELYQKKLGFMIGPFGVVFFAIGLWGLYVSDRKAECFIIVAFIGAALVGPLIHNVVIRHVAIIIPIIILVEGIGVTYFLEAIGKTTRLCLFQKSILLFLSLFFIIAPFVISLKHVYAEQPVLNREYDPVIIKKYEQIIKTVAVDDNIAEPLIVSKKPYLPYYAHIRGLLMPYTDYEGLVTYCKINSVDFLCLRHHLMKKYPFISVFKKKDILPEFMLLSYDEDQSGGVTELYRFNKSSVH